MCLSMGIAPGTTNANERRKNNEETETKNPLHDRGGGDGVFNINKEK